MARIKITIHCVRCGVAFRRFPKTNPRLNRFCSKGCARRTHGLTANNRVPKEFVAWTNAKHRCHDPSDKQFVDYGGRGIVMCERWRTDFGAFYADMGQRPLGMTLDRIDNNGPYAPDNCRWATPRTQANNTRRNHWLTIKGDRLTVAQAARQYGISVKTVWTRLGRGWPEEAAVCGR